MGVDFCRLLLTEGGQASTQILNLSPPLVSTFDENLFHIEHKCF